MNHAKNDANNLGKADITAHVNFNLLNEFFKEVCRPKELLPKNNF